MIDTSPHLFRGLVMKMLKKPEARYLHVSPPFSGLNHEDAEEAESTLFTRLPFFRGLIMKMLKKPKARYLHVSPFFGA